MPLMKSLCQIPPFVDREEIAFMAVLGYSRIVCILHRGRDSNVDVFIGRVITVGPHHLAQEVARRKEQDLTRGVLGELSKTLLIGALFGVKDPAAWLHPKMTCLKRAGMWPMIGPLTC